MQQGDKGNKHGKILVTAKSNGKYWAWAFHCTLFFLTLCILNNFHNKNLMNLTENPKLFICYIQVKIYFYKGKRLDLRN